MALVHRRRTQADALARRRGRGLRSGLPGPPLREQVLPAGDELDRIDGRG